MRKIGITDTTWRDAHQSLLATRMKTEDMLPIAKKMDEHRAILQAILNKEERKAQQLVAKHLEGAKKSLMKTLRIK